MKKRVMFAIVGWLGGTLMGWHLQQLTGWHCPMYLGFLTGIIAVLGGERTGNIKSVETPATSLSLFSSERRHSE